MSTPSITRIVDQADQRRRVVNQIIRAVALDLRTHIQISPNYMIKEIDRGSERQKKGPGRCANSGSGPE